MPRTSRAAAAFSATGRPERQAVRPGRKFVVNCHRRMNWTRFRDASLEFDEIGMSHNAVGNMAAARFRYPNDDLL